MFLILILGSIIRNVYRVRQCTHTKQGSWLIFMSSRGFGKHWIWELFYTLKRILVSVSFVFLVRYGLIAFNVMMGFICIG